MDIKISENKLDEFIKYFGKSIVGTTCRHFENINNQNELKATVKDELYKQLRNFKALLIAFQSGNESFSLTKSETIK